MEQNHAYTGQYGREEQLKMVASALQQQRRSVRAYEWMIAAAKTREDKELLAAMRREDRRHYYLLEGIYEELTGEVWMPERLQVSMPRHYIAMLQVALCDKLDAVTFYEQLRDALSCVKQQELLEIIIGDQKEQVRILATMYKENMA